MKIQVYQGRITANVITDSQNNRLSRYYMLSFTMRLQKFSGKQPEQQQMGPGIGRPGMGHSGF
jgi:hypothetical protein